MPAPGVTVGSDGDAGERSPLRARPSGPRPKRPRSATPSVPLADPSYRPDLSPAVRRRLLAAHAAVVLILRSECGLTLEAAYERLERLPPPALWLEEDKHLPLCRRRALCVLCGAVVRGPTFFRHRARCFRERRAAR